MKKLLGIVVLCLLLVSCRYDGENYGFGKRLTVIEQNNDLITIQWFPNIASKKLIFDKAQNHCSQFKKYPIAGELVKGAYDLQTLTYKCEKPSISGNKNFVVLYLYGDEIDALPNAEKHCLKFQRTAKYKSKEDYKVVFDCVD